MFNDSSFWQYNVYADSLGFPGEKASNDSGVIENVDFDGSGVYGFGTLGGAEGQHY